jgi:ankyrin repeat protein
MNRLVVFLTGGMLACAVPVVADGPLTVQEMLDDFGISGAAAGRPGKAERCTYGGTRTLTVSVKGDATAYRGDYFNCRERGATRDGLYEFVTKGEAVLSSSVKPTVNGELFAAAQAGELDKVRDLIRKKADPNYAEEIERADGEAIKGWTPLMSAGMNGRLDMVKLLVEAGAWVNFMNGEAVGALWLAANTGHRDCADYLIRHGAYLDNQGLDDVTPVMIAAINGHKDVVASLVAAGANVNLRHRDGDSALMFAVSGGHNDIARMLLAAGADVNVQNRYGVTALIITAVENNEDIARELIARHADPTLKTGGKTALDIAEKKGHAGIAALLKAAR